MNESPTITIFIKWKKWDPQERIHLISLLMTVIIDKINLLDILHRLDVHKVGLKEYFFKSQYLKKPDKKDKKSPELEDFMRILYKPNS